MTMQTQVGFLKFTYRSATARLTIWDDNTGVVSGVYSRERGQGHATLVMMEVEDFADNNRMVLTLDVSSYGPGKDGLTNEQLEAFYATFGFKRLPESGLPVQMRRDPVSIEP